MGSQEIRINALLAELARTGAPFYKQNNTQMRQGSPGTCHYDMIDEVGSRATIAEDMMYPVDLADYSTL